jgi:hypothetical protein
LILKSDRFIDMMRPTDAAIVVDELFGLADDSGDDDDDDDDDDVSLLTDDNEVVGVVDEGC